MVSKQSLSTCDQNGYSAPVSLVGQTVGLEICSDHISVYRQYKPVASHKQLNGYGVMAVKL